MRSDGSIGLAGCMLAQAIAAGHAIMGCGHTIVAKRTCRPASDG
jgi:hypothetical protein